MASSSSSSSSSSANPPLAYFPPTQASSTSSVDTYDSLLSLPAGPPAASSASVAGLPSRRLPSATPSDATSFARLFPSRLRLAVRLDDAMNVRVDTEAAPGHAVQLFHLRMRDLARRHFSLRRYARASGREVCSSTRAFAPPPPTVSSALRSLRRASLTSTHSVASSDLGLASPPSPHASSATIASPAQPDLNPHAHALVPTDSIRLEFANYARVDLHRHSRRSVRYSFEWWGRKYAWRRAVDKTLGSVAWHLVCHGAPEPVAHVVPDLRSPSQIDADERAGVWLPPSYMWISDQSIVHALTDVADVVVATGLIALVDDCILRRWPLDNKPHASTALHPEPTPVKSGLRALFSRKPSSDHPHSPLRLQNTVAVC